MHSLIVDMFFFLLGVCSSIKTWSGMCLHVFFAGSISKEFPFFVKDYCSYLCVHVCVIVITSQH